MAKFLTIELGPLPVEALNHALDLELNQGFVILSRAAQVHALKRHPEDFYACREYLHSIIQNPLYARDDFKNDGKIELIGRAHALDYSLLVAITITRDINGCYHITSFDPVSDKKIENRRASGHLKRIIR